MGPPYPPRVAGVGGVPTTTVDDPITAVFLFLYICGAATHMTILQLNLRRSHKFIASGALFGFCMTRVLACIMRLVWSTHHDSVRIALVANIFVNAGVIIVVIVNILFAQRILRAMHPNLGWHRSVHFIFLAYFASIPLMLVALIFSIVQQLYTLDPNILRIDHDIQLVGSTYFAVAAFLPIPILLTSALTRRTSSKPHKPVEKFGSGRFRTKLIILLTAATLISLGASFRAGTAYVPRPATNPAWYHSKACFYCFNFMVEIIVIFLYAIMRVDLRFHVRNGSKKAGDYTGREDSGIRLETEEEFERDFSPDSEAEKVRGEQRKETDLERGAAVDEAK